MPSRNKGSVPWKIWVPAELALRTELRYCNPLTGKPNYGVRSHLMVALLREFDSALARMNISNENGAITRLVERIIAEDHKEHNHP